MHAAQNGQQVVFNRRALQINFRLQISHVDNPVAERQIVVRSSSTAGYPHKTSASVSQAYQIELIHPGIRNLDIDPLPNRSLGQ
jgi:hypothetical protein